ncbi:unnamed protein product [Owenia fusiformis]|uniref:Uncharacterized protein n=1 Tax=Owenia fusiformis TaxID=6347 RepID=A0A8J1Y9R4_OWEFU|nr:unnamed protein product [Owenia fusiformis]
MVDVHTNASDHKYCGPVYLAVIVDSKDVIPESNEDNNMAVIPITVLCFGDVFALGDSSLDVGYGQTEMYRGVEYTVTLDTTIYNIYSSDLTEGKENWQLNLYLSNFPTINQGSQALLLNTFTSVTYPNGVSPLLGLHSGESLKVEDIQYNIAADMIPADMGYRYIVLSLDLPSGVPYQDIIRVNNVKAWPLAIKDTSPGVDIVVTEFDIAEAQVVVDGATNVSITVTGSVDLDDQDPSLVNSVLYWSLDDQLDDSDLESGHCHHQWLSQHST